MIIWFAVVSAVIVAEVFQSPMVDYRIVAFGALVPLIDLVSPVEVPFLHSLLAPILALTAIMAATVGRRLLRRRLLGVPIGMFLHLVLDGSWSDQAMFWWPLFGSDVGSAPEATNVALRLGLDVVGVAVAVVAYRRYGLAQAENRQLLWRRGHLQRGYLTS